MNNKTINKKLIPEKKDCNLAIDILLLALLLLAGFLCFRLWSVIESFQNSLTDSTYLLPIGFATLFMSAIFLMISFIGLMRSWTLLKDRAEQGIRRRVNELLFLLSLVPFIFFVIFQVFLMIKR